MVISARAGALAPSRSRDLSFSVLSFLSNRISARPARSASGSANPWTSSLSDGLSAKIFTRVSIRSAASSGRAARPGSNSITPRSEAPGYSAPRSANGEVAALARVLVIILMMMPTTLNSGSSVRPLTGRCRSILPCRSLSRRGETHRRLVACSLLISRKGELIDEHVVWSIELPVFR